MSHRLPLLTFFGIALFPWTTAAGAPPASTFVCGIDGEPVVGCVVEARPGSGVESLLDHKSTLDTTSPGATFVTDTNGRADLTLTPGAWSLQVQHQGCVGFGSAWIPQPGDHHVAPDASPLVIDIGLNRVRRIEVIAQDANARPLSGVIVALLDPDRRNVPRSVLLETNQDDFPWGVTDDRGSLVFILDRDSRYGLAGAKRLQATALRYGGELAHAIQPVGSGDATIPLEVPPTVALRLRLSGDKPIHLLWANGDSSPKSSYTHVSWQSGTTLLDVLEVIISRWSLRLPSSGSTLRVFAPAAQVTFVTRANGHEEATRTVTLGEALEQELTLPLGPRYAKLSLKIVDESGEPRKTRGLRFAAQSTGTQRPVHVLQTGRTAGADPAHSQTAFLPAGPAGQLVVFAPDRRPLPAATPSPLAKVAIPALQPGATASVHFVIPQIYPLLVAGRVADSNGQPVAGALVVASGNATIAEARVPWHDSYQSVSSRSDGSFRIYGSHRKDLLYTVEVKRRLRSRSQAFEPGAQEVTIDVVRPGEIAGRVRCVLPELRKRIRLRLYSNGTQLKETSALRPDGKFQFKRLIPRTYAIQVELVGRTVLEVSDIAVRAGETVRHKKLEDLFVGHDFSIAEVRVRTKQGVPVVGCSIQTETNEDVSAWGILESWVETDADGLARIVLRRGYPPTITVRPSFSKKLRQFGSQTFENPTFPLDVVLDCKD